MVSENMSLFTKNILESCGAMLKSSYWIDFIDDVPKKKVQLLRQCEFFKRQRQEQNVPLFHSFSVPVTLCNFIIEQVRKTINRAQVLS